MTDYTISQLAVRVLKDTGLLGVDENPSAEELADAVEVCQSEIMLLEAAGIPLWGGGQTVIPQQYFTLLSRRIGLAVGTSYGLMTAAQATLAMPIAEIELRRLGTVPATGQRQVAEYF